MEEKIYSTGGDGEHPERQLNLLGREGWELVSSNKTGYRYEVRHVLKRTFGAGARFEYKVYDTGYDGEHPGKQLNSLGSAGWKLVSAYASGVGYKKVHILKRKIGSNSRFQYKVYETGYEGENPTGELYSLRSLGWELVSSYPRGVGYSECYILFKEM